MRWFPSRILRIGRRERPGVCGAHPTPVTAPLFWSFCSNPSFRMRFKERERRRYRLCVTESRAWRREKRAHFSEKAVSVSFQARKPIVESSRRAANSVLCSLVFHRESEESSRGMRGCRRTQHVITGQRFAARARERVACKSRCSHYVSRVFVVLFCFLSVCRSPPHPAELFLCKPGLWFSEKPKVRASSFDL